MNNNIGTGNRIARAVGALLLTMCAIAGPYPLTLRLLAFALPALYLVVTALVGSCAFKAVMGRLTSSSGR